MRCSINGPLVIPSQATQLKMTRNRRCTPRAYQVME
jgi:hypothetical protein